MSKQNVQSQINKWITIKKGEKRSGDDSCAQQKSKKEFTSESSEI